MNLMFINHLIIFFLSFFIVNLSASGGYDHGTSTGKDKIQIDLTWNPFNYFEYGQSYLVFGYGITNRIDIHGYYSDHGNFHKGVDSYYYGLFYQFMDSQYLDLATAIGRRRIKDLSYSHIFFPQVLFNLKLGRDYTLGGSLVNVKADSKSPLIKIENKWLTFDIALFIPIKKYVSEIKIIDEIKIGIGIFSNRLNKESDSPIYLPTYSIDIKLNKLK